MYSGALYKVCEKSDKSNQVFEKSCAISTLRCFDINKIIHSSLLKYDLPHCAMICPFLLAKDFNVPSLNHVYFHEYKTVIMTSNYLLKKTNSSCMYHHH